MEQPIKSSDTTSQHEVKTPTNQSWTYRIEELIKDMASHSTYPYINLNVD